MCEKVPCLDLGSKYICRIMVVNVFNQLELVDRVDQPIIDRLPLTEHFDRSFSFFSILSDLKCYRSAFSSSRNHLSNAKPRDKPKKRKIKKYSFRIA